MVDVLSAEVPPVDLEDLVLPSGPEAQLLPPDLNSVGGWDGLIERLVPEAATELSARVFRASSIRRSASARFSCTMAEF